MFDLSLTGGSLTLYPSLKKLYLNWWIIFYSQNYFIIFKALFFSKDASHRLYHDILSLNRSYFLAVGSWSCLCPISPHHPVACLPAQDILPDCLYWNPEKKNLQIIKPAWITYGRGSGKLRKFFCLSFPGCTLKLSSESLKEICVSPFKNLYFCYAFTFWEYMLFGVLYLCVVSRSLTIGYTLKVLEFKMCFSPRTAGWMVGFHCHATMFEEYHVLSGLSFYWNIYS